jgi:hypothetical protein
MQVLHTPSPDMSTNQIVEAFLFRELFELW